MVLRTDPAHPDSSTIERAATVLLAGDLLVAPTETRYGLVARADRQDVLEKLCGVKQRSLNHPTALLIEKFADAERYGRVNRVANDA